jgi:diguanylate cyclase (GGDEF)-like protein/PAS domain S-box-containing protein
MARAEVSSVRFDRRRISTIAVVIFSAGPLAALALPWLSRTGLIADTPLWILFLLLLACSGANAVIWLVERRIDPTIAMHLRTGVSAFSTAWFVYASGWGPILVMAYAIGIADAIRVRGSRAWLPGLAWSGVAVACGQMAVAIHVAPSVLRPAVAHAAAVATFGCLFILARTLGEAARAAERATAQIDKARANFHDLVQHAADVITLVNEHDEIAYISPGISPLLGMTPEHCTGRSVIEVFGDDVHNELAQVRAAVDVGEFATCEWSVRNHAGARRRVQGRVTRRLDNSMVLNLRDVTQQRALEKELERQARVDALTGLPNRAALTRQLSGLEPIETVLLLFIDLDGFKEVNDSLGHERGDHVLREVAQCIARAVPIGVTVGRLGGDEFLAIMERGDTTDAEELATHLIRSIEDLGSALTPFHLSASIGIAAGTPGESPERLLHRADQAMYRAKGAGPGQFALHT